MAEQFEYGIRLSLGQLINAIQVSRYLLEACRRKDYLGSQIGGRNALLYNCRIIRNKYYFQFN